MTLERNLTSRVVHSVHQNSTQVVHNLPVDSNANSPEEDTNNNSPPPEITSCHASSKSVMPVSLLSDDTDIPFQHATLELSTSVEEARCEVSPPQPCVLPSAPDSIEFLRTAAVIRNADSSFSLASSPPLSTSITGTVIPQAKSCPSLGPDGPRVAYRRTNSFWDGIFGCLRPMWALMGGRGRAMNLNAERESQEPWEIDFEEIQELTYVGSGAQGVVYRGVLKGEEVAVKRVKERQDTDIKHLRKLHHPNVIKFVGVCSQDPVCLSIIMEFAPFGQLYNILKKHKDLSSSCIVDWIGQVCNGMNYLHQNKIVHRDLKSPNVLVSLGSHESYTLKISDFGTCREWIGGQGARSTHMTFVGTPAWMAPEMLRGELCSPKVDCWSFGVVIWEILTGEEPFHNVPSNSIMWQVGNYKRTLHIPASVPMSYVQVLRGCWRQDARGRPGFRDLQTQLELASADLLELSHEDLILVRDAWRTEIADSLLQMKQENPAKREAELIRRRKRELQDAATLRQRYEDKLARTDNLIMETTQFYLQVEERQRKLEEREKRLSRMRKELVKFVQTAPPCPCGSAPYLNRALHDLGGHPVGLGLGLGGNTGFGVKPSIKQRVEKLGRKLSQENLRLFGAGGGKFASMEDVRSVERIQAARSRGWRRTAAPNHQSGQGQLLPSSVSAHALMQSSTLPPGVRLSDHPEPVKPVVSTAQSKEEVQELHPVVEEEPQLRNNPGRRRSAERSVSCSSGSNHNSASKLDKSGSSLSATANSSASASSGGSCVLDDKRSQVRRSTDKLRDELEATMVDSLSDKEGEIGRMRHQLQQSERQQPTSEGSVTEDEEEQEEDQLVSMREVEDAVDQLAVAQVDRTGSAVMRPESAAW